MRLVYEPSKKFCPNCGSLILWGDTHCRKCGALLSDPPLPGTSGHFVHADVATNYSGTVTISGSASRAMVGIEGIKEYLSEHPAFKQARDEELLDPVLRALDYVEEVIEKQEIERIKDKPEHKEEYRQKIEDYRKLIDDDEEEPAFQSFFKENPNFLIGDQIRSESKPEFGSEFEPDFLIESSSSLHWIIEIEKPRKKIFRKDTQPRADFTHAETQIRDYMRWVRRNIRYLRDKDPAHVDREWPHITAENMRGLLVIGKKRQTLLKFGADHCLF